MNKTNKVQLHLIENGSITSWEAIKEYGATRLSSIIFNLRKRGMNIETIMTDFVDKYGDKSKYAVYTLMEDNNGKNE